MLDGDFIPLLRRVSPQGWGVIPLFWRGTPQAGDVIPLLWRGAPQGWGGHFQVSLCHLTTPSGFAVHPSNGGE